MLLSVRAERDTSGLVHVYQIIIDKLTVAGFEGSGFGYIFWILRTRDGTKEFFFAFKTSLLLL